MGTVHPSKRLAVCLVEVVEVGSGVLPHWRWLTWGQTFCTTSSVLVLVLSFQCVAEMIRKHGPRQGKELSCNIIGSHGRENQTSPKISHASRYLPTCRRSKDDVWTWVPHWSDQNPSRCLYIQGCTLVWCVCLFQELKCQKSRVLQAASSLHSGDLIQTCLAWHSMQCTINYNIYIYVCFTYLMFTYCNSSVCSISDISRRFVVRRCFENCLFVSPVFQSMPHRLRQRGSRLPRLPRQSRLGLKCLQGLTNHNEAIHTLHLHEH